MQTLFLIQDLNKARSVGVKNKKLAHKLLRHVSQVYSYLIICQKKSFDIWHCFKTSLAEAPELLKFNELAVIRFK